MSTVKDNVDATPGRYAPGRIALRRPSSFAARTDAGADVVRVRIEPRVDSARTRWALGQLLRAANLEGRFLAVGASDLYYGGDGPAARAAAVWIPAAGGEFAAGGRAGPEPIRLDGLLTPSSCVVRGVPGANNRLAIDLVAATAWWLSLASESDITTRDLHGRIAAVDSALGRSRAISRPPVQDYAERLFSRLRAARGRGAARPRWPHGRRFAAALSHDVDMPERTSDGRRILRDWLSGRRGLRGVWWDLAAAVRRSGAREALLAGAAARRAWDFNEFCAAEAARGFRSAFYFAVVDRSAGHPCDVSYRASQSRYRRLFAALAAPGWEIGLHAAYLTAQQRPTSKQQTDQLARWSGGAVRGVRHHYLQLRREEPLRGMADHLAAGLRYDSSIGFNDGHGFRAGTALPYQPFAAAYGAMEGFVELPMTLADMHLPRDDAEAATAITIDHLETVRRLGGLATLNWHVGNWCDAPGWKAAYLAALDWLAARPDAWVATPGDVAGWWLDQDETALPPPHAADAPTPAEAGLPDLAADLQ